MRTATVCKLYDISRSEFFIITRTRGERNDLSAVSLSEFVYAMGRSGYLDGPGPANVKCFGLFKKQRTEIAPLGNDLCPYGACAYDGLMMIDERRNSTVENYNPNGTISRRRNLTEIAPLGNDLCSYGACAYDGLMMIDERRNSTVENYNPNGTISRRCNLIMIAQQ
uniref:Uncharacterized protein n=1 Tax=Glossina brevipalpis TaxID=37001 RepID=A0A1A9W156_9MUSC